VQQAHVGMTVGNKPPQPQFLADPLLAIPPRGDHGIGQGRTEQEKWRESVRRASIVGLEYYDTR
jgi:hypothetical protein